FERLVSIFSLPARHFLECSARRGEDLWIPHLAKEKIDEVRGAKGGDNSVASGPRRRIRADGVDDLIRRRRRHGREHNESVDRLRRRRSGKRPAMRVERW